MVLDKIVNLRGTNGIIVKVRCRDRNGKNVHRNQFSVADKKSVERELRIWKDKLGVPVQLFRNIITNPIDNEELEKIKDMMKKDIETTKAKVKKAFNK